MAADTKKKANKDEELWFLKIHDGTIFGPVPLKGLRSWAEQGRIAPGNLISKDKETWIQTETLPALGLTWWVERKEGTVQGPFNKQAIDLLIKDGTIPEDARLVERSIEESTSQRTASDQKAASNSNGDTRSAQDARRMKELETRLQQALTEIEKLKSAKKPKVNIPDEVHRLRQKLEKSQKDTETYKTQAKRLVSEKKALQKQITEREASAAEDGNTIEQLLDKKEKAFDEERLAYEEEMDDLKAHLETTETSRRMVREQLEEEKRTLAETLEAANTREQKLREEVEALQADVAGQNDTPFRAPGPVLSAIIRAQTERTDAALETEREYFETFRDAFIEKQQKLREQLRQLQSIGASTKDAPLRVSGTGKSDAQESARLREQLLRTEQEHRREVEINEAKEQQQTRRMKHLEAQLAETRQRLTEAEDEAAELRSLKDELRTQEHQLALVRAQYEEERSHWRKREEEHARTADASDRSHTSATQSALRGVDMDKAATPANFNVRKWMKLR